MSDTSKLNIVTEYILKVLSEKFGTKLNKQKIQIGKGKIYKEFLGVSKDKSIIILICYHSGKAKNDNIPTAKINGLFSKCYFMEKTQFKHKYIYFLSKEFFDIFSSRSEGIIKGIELKLFENLPEEYNDIIKNVLSTASDEMA